MSLDEDLLTACAGFEIATTGFCAASVVNSILVIPTYVPSVHESVMSAVMAVPDGCLHTAMAAVGLYAVSVGLRQVAYNLMCIRPGVERLPMEIVKDPMMEYIDE